MVNPIIPNGYSPAQEQQEPQSRGGSKVKKALANGFLLGGVGAGLGATLLSPKTIKSATGLMNLDQDTFVNTLKKVPENAPEDAKKAKEIFNDCRSEINKINSENAAQVAKIFPDEKVSAISIDEAIHNHDSSYKSLAEVEEQIAKNKLEEEATLLKNKAATEAKANLVKELGESRGVKVSRSELASCLKEHNIENPKELAKTIIPPRWKFWKSHKLNPEKVMEEIGKNKIESAAELQKTAKAISPELQELMEVVKDSKNINKDGNLSKAAYEGYIESKNKAPQLKPEAETLFNSIKKYMPKNRAGGALKIGAIGAGVGIVAGLIMGRNKQD